MIDFNFRHEMTKLMEVKEDPADIIRMRGTGLYPSEESPLTETEILGLRKEFILRYLDLVGMSNERKIEDIDGYLTLFEHEPKTQDPRFTTTFDRDFND